MVWKKEKAEPITDKIEEQTKKIEEQTEKQLALMPDLIKFDEPPKVPMLLDAPLPTAGVDIDMDIGIDKDIIKNHYNLKMPTELIGKTPEELYRIVNDLQQEQTRFKEGENSSPEYKVAHRISEALKNYSKSLRGIAEGDRCIKQGKGLSRHLYKMGKDGKYGHLQIDVPQLVENKRLVVIVGGSIMMDENVDSDLIDLLTKRMKKKKKKKKNIF